MVTVIIPAAGQGKRMAAGVNKVFLELSGKPILSRTVKRFSECKDVDRLIIVVAEEEIAAIKRLLVGIPNVKPFEVVAGGSERQYSVANALKVVSDETDIVLVHDGARPLVSEDTIKKVIAAAMENGAAIAAVPEKNTVKIVNNDSFVMRTPDRATLWEVQTPQGFKREIIEQAYKQAEKESFLGTDDSSLVERLGIPVKVVMSEYQNIKITTPEDLLVGEAFVREQRLALAKEGINDLISGLADRVKHHHRFGREDDK